MRKLYGLFLSGLVMAFGALYFYPFNISGAVLESDSNVVCFIGDTGTGDDNQRMTAHLMSYYGCEDVYILGDVVYENGINGRKIFKRNFHDVYRNYSYNVYILLGNHDYRGKIDLYKKYMGEHERYVFPNNFYMVRYTDGLCLYALDTTPYEMIGKSKIAKAQEAWLDRELKNDGCKNRWALAHHPYKSSGKHGDARGKVKSFWERYQDMFVATIAGHDHNVEFRQTNGRIHITSGAGAKLRPIKTKCPGWCASKLGFVRFIRSIGRFEFITKNGIKYETTL